VAEESAGLQHRLVCIVPPQLVAYYGVPKAIVVVVVVHWQVRSPLLPLLKQLGWLGEAKIFVLIRGLAPEFLFPDLVELHRGGDTKVAMSQVNSGLSVRTFSWWYRLNLTRSQAV
jgi:hypothetical protein